MKIDSTLHNVAATQSKAKADKSKSRASSSDERQGVKDNVDLTFQSALMQSLEQSLADLPASDSSKVEEVRLAIAEGRFRVDEEVVAEGLVQDAIDGLQHANRQP